MRHIHRALLTLQLTHALILTTAPRRRRRTRCKESKLTSDYVESLFDGFADTFEGVLVEQLEYCAPAKVAEAAINATAYRGKYASALDAGCGTGLAGLELRETPAGTTLPRNCRGSLTRRVDSRAAASTTSRRCRIASTPSMRPRQVQDH